jgi:N-acetylneuraminate synthase
MAARRTFVIAEAGVNHNGSLDRALELVGIAAAAGADAVKFQTFVAHELATQSAGKAEYQRETTSGQGGQLEMLRELELTPSMHARLVAECKERGIAFMSTAFDRDSLDFLATLDMPAIKIPSGDVTAGPLLLQAARLRRPLIMSTGMSTIPEVEQALGVLAFGLTTEDGEAPSQAAFATAYASARGQAALNEFVTLLHCVSAYPAPIAEIHLRAMDTLREVFGLAVGYSDHALGINVALAAVARGATVIEKHFTVDRALPGPDHRASLEPADLAAMMSGIREIEVALGSAGKAPSPSESLNLGAARRSIVAKRAIRRGELFNDTNLTLKRPAGGTSPMLYWSLLGRAAPHDYAADEVLDL